MLFVRLDGGFLLGLFERARFPCRGVREVHGVDLFDRHALGLGDAEECKHKAQSEAAGPDKADTGADTRLDLRRGKLDDEVEQPIGSGSERDTDRRKTDRERFATDDPSHRTPRRSESSDKDASKGDEGFTGLFVVGSSLGEGASDDLTGEHDECADQEDGTTTSPVDSEDTGEGHDDVDRG